ncbi:MAG TPA: metal ABC transporter permease [Thermodesulfobacteriota bacterium]|nr:metal ABC transporter permease [Thermodesulfobacteriota bacterium]
MENCLLPLYNLLQTWVPFEWAQYAFVWRAMAAMVIIAPLCAALGVHVVNFRMAFFSDAISHSTFAGVALGVMWGIDPLVTLVGFGVLSGLSITLVRNRSDLSSDTVISVILSATVAIGITVLYAQKETRNLESYLYGAVLAISDNELMLLLALGILVFVLMGFLFNRLFLISLNKNLAASRGISVKLLEYTFSVVLAVIVTFSIRAIGLFLVTAMLVVPSATARNLARGISSLFWTALICALISGVGGILLSFYLDAPAGATTILIGCLLFFLSWLKAHRV